MYRNVKENYLFRREWSKLFWLVAIQSVYQNKCNWLYARLIICVSVDCTRTTLRQDMLNPRSSNYILIFFQRLVDDLLFLYPVYVMFIYVEPFWLTCINFNSIRISKHTPAKMWDEIAYQFPNVNDFIVEAWHWRINSISHFSRDWSTVKPVW